MYQYSWGVSIKTILSQYSFQDVNVGLYILCIQKESPSLNYSHESNLFFPHFINTMPYERFAIPSNATPIDEIQTKNDSEHPSQPSSEALRRFIRTHHEPPSVLYGTANPIYPSRDERVMVEEQNVIMPTIKQNITYNCADIYQHILDCPVCQRLHKTDNTVYICIIIILLVFCILLFKKAFLQD